MPPFEKINELLKKNRSDDPFDGMTEKERVMARMQDALKHATDGLTKRDFFKSFELLLNATSSAFFEMNKKIDAKLSSVRSGVDGRDGVDGKDGKSIVGPKGEKGNKGDRGEKGEKGDTGVVIFGKKGKDGSPDTPEQIREKLELLVDEERLDASAIKNLPEVIQKNSPTIIGGHGPLWQLQDVEVSGISTNQSIKWDGVKWVPFTPSGTGDVSKVGTPVNNQVGVWTGDGTIEGDADLTFDTTTNTLTTGIVTVTDDAYGAGWNGSTAVPTKNAIYDKIETISSGGVSESLAIAYAVAL